MTSTSTKPPAADTEPGPRGRRWLLVSLGVIVAIVLAVGAGTGGVLLARPGALPGIVVDDLAVGGMSEEQVRAAIKGMAQRRGADRTITVTRPELSVPGFSPLPEAQLQVDAAELGYELRVEATVDWVMYRGRQRNLVAAVGDHVRAFREQTPVAPVERLDQERLDAWVAQAVERFEVTPREAEVAFDGAGISRRDPALGVRVDAGALRAQVHEALMTGGPRTVAVRTEALAPATTVDDVDALVAQAQRVVSGPVRLHRDGAEVTFSPEQLGGLFEIRSQPDAEPPLRLAELDPGRVGALIPADTVAGFEHAPVEARVEVTDDGVVQISPSSEGFRFDLDAATAQLQAVALSAERTGGLSEAVLEGEVLVPGLTTEQAHALEVVEPVASFTTEHACCQGRVTNIQLMADMVDGALVRPGETFSVNDHVGERTTAKGFVPGGAIMEGEFVDQVGGGVSQFATTMYNAAYFGGYELVEYRPHSYYISRYPPGREATLNYPNIDLKVRNNSPYGMVVKTSYTPTSVTVTLWGRNWVEVESITGERTNIRSGAVRDGFDITDTRVLRFPDGREEREERFTRYLPEPPPAAG